MYRYRKILSGDYIKKEVDGISYIIAEEKDIKPKQIEFSDNHKSELIEEFISMDFMNCNEILKYTRKYGPIYSTGLEAFKVSAKVLREKLPEDIDDTYPLKELFAFSEYDFRYFHGLVINIWNLQNDMAQKRHDKKLLWDFLCLLFQPYAWDKLHSKFLGLKSTKTLAMFAKFFYEMVKQDYSNICTQSVERFIYILSCEAINLKFITFVKGERNYKRIEIPEEFEKCLDNGDFWNIIYMLEKIRNVGAFDYLEDDYEDFQKNINLNNLDNELFEKIYCWGKILICDIINDYISTISLFINENGDFFMEMGDKFLINIIFDELAVLCQFYETRKCKFRKCHKYFIAKKGKVKNYCCKDCADKEIKYRKREGRI